MLAVSTPAFGMVVGAKTVDDMIGNKTSIQPAEGPPVVTRPMTAAKELPKSSVPPVEPTKTDPGKTEPVTPTPTVAPAPAVAVAGAPAPVAAGDDESKAAALLKMADNYIACGMRPKAQDVLKELLAKYPKTQAAAKAQTLAAKP